MANPSRFSPGTLHALRSASARGSESLPHSAAATVDMPADHANNGANHGASNDEIPGPRKLVRPKLPEGAKRRIAASRSDDAMSSHLIAQQGAFSAHAYDSEDAHAEAFYFQKQMQTQTLMVFVLEGGEEIEGYIEWFDRNAIKVRNGKKTLIYKAAIKYLYKAGEEHSR
ncbi:RNA chaperone Hfq [Silvibacterium sp.]|uniref:RNA chaperone Hfq n=1 Tax=Silvibacterium sp. TaxID=1964179 RepID=UPI0039E30FBB